MMVIGRRMLKRIVQRFVWAQRLHRWHLRRQHDRALPDWGSVIASNPTLWSKAVASARSDRSVLLATSNGGHPLVPFVDSLLAAALTLRGADVHFLLCDSFLPACHMAEVGLMSPRAFARRGPQGYFCHGCFSRGKGIYTALGLQIHRYSDLVTAQELDAARTLSTTLPVEDIEHCTHDGVAIGEHAMAGALRYLARSTLHGQAHAEAVLRRFLQAALLTASATRNLFRGRRDLNIVSVNHAIYVPHGTVAEVARAEGRRVVTWNVAYRKRSFIFSHTDTYHHTLMTEPQSEWEGITWTEAQTRDIMDYLRSRRRGGRDWIVFHDRNPTEDLRLISRALGVDFSKPCIGMLTNVAWDAQLHYPANAFPNMLDWVTTTIRYFAGRPDLQLIIRVHPAEVSGDIPSRQPLMKEVHRAFPTLPPNVFIVPPESRISTYVLMDVCNAVLIYGTKTGVELTSLGIPVIVAGEAWIRNKGMTHDTASREEYLRLLDRLPFSARMSEDAVQRARKYAYHFFFRRMIPIAHVQAMDGWPRFRLDLPSLEDLLPGRDKGLDVVCDGILHGTPFVFRAEEHGVDGA